MQYALLIYSTPGAIEVLGQDEQAATGPCLIRPGLFRAGPGRLR
jgi:hypothetical protein